MSLNLRLSCRFILRPLLLVCLLLSPTISQAHLLKIFAHQQAIQSTGKINVKGKIYFAGANPVSEVSVKVLDAQAQLVTSVVSDAQGKFSLVLADNNYQLVANSLDGHIAKWSIRASDSQNKSQLNDLQMTQTAIEQQPESSAVNVNLTQLEEMMARQLAQSIEPLNEKIINLQEKSRFRDILGALGYIAGLFGLLVLWRQRASGTK